MAICFSHYSKLYEKFSLSKNLVSVNSNQSPPNIQGVLKIWTNLLKAVCTSMIITISTNIRIDKIENTGPHKKENFVVEN